MILNFASALILFKFLAVVLVIAFPPGYLFYKWVTGRATLVFSLPVGLFLVTLETYLLYWLGAFSIVPLLLSIQPALLLAAFASQFHFSRPRFSILAIIAVLAVLFINCQLLLPFGQARNSGMLLLGAHFVDSTWHLSLINSLANSFPPANPLYSSTALSNYHYLVDLQISLLHRLSGISVPDLFFRLFGPLYLLLLSIQVYQFAKKFSGKEIGGVLALLLVMASSNLYYLAGFFFPHAQINPSVAWVEFFSSKIVNYPLLVSLSLLFSFMDMFLYSSLSKAKSILLGILAGALFAVKSHTAVVLVASLLFVNPLAFISSLPIVLLFSRLIIASPATALVVSPFWFIKAMYETWDHLNVPDWELRRQTLLSLHAYAGIGKLYLQGLFWFMFINFGLLIPGLFALFSRQLALKVRWFLFSLFAASLGLAMLFIYGAMSIVTIQFIYPVIISLSLLLAFLVSRLPKLASIGFSLAIFALLFPGVIYTLGNYHPVEPNIPGGLVQVALHLSQLPPGAVVAGPEFWSGSVIPAYSNHPVYVGDMQILDSLGLNYSSRQKEVVSALACQGPVPQASYIISTVPLKCYHHLYTSGPYSLYAF